MYRRGNNYGPSQGGYEPYTNPQVNVYVEAISAVGERPGYGGGFGRRGGFGCDICGRRRCRCGGEPGLFGGRRQGFLSTIVGGTMSMMEAQHMRRRDEHRMAMMERRVERRVEENMQYARERGLETRPVQSQTRSRSAVREDGRDSEKDVRSKDRQGARAHSEDKSDEDDRGGRMDEKHGLSRDDRRREERMDEKLPSYQAATKKN